MTKINTIFYKQGRHDSSLAGKIAKVLTTLPARICFHQPVLFCKIQARLFILCEMVLEKCTAKTNHFGKKRVKYPAKAWIGSHNQ